MGHRVSTTSTQRAEKLRLDGNLYFSKLKFAAAIDAYTEAITLCPNVPVYWSNRALCHRKRNDWTKVEEDCRRVIELDRTSVKGHYMLGLALLQRKAYADGVKELEKALDLERGADPKGYMVEEIWQELAKARYLEWEQESTMRAWELQTLKEACETALKEKYEHDLQNSGGLVDHSNSVYPEQLKALGQVIDKALQDVNPTEVPDYLCCKITLDIFRDPVITPSGITYERSAILEHLNKVGKFDPITRELLNQSQLVPNLALKEAVNAFLRKNGWAYRTY